MYLNYLVSFPHYTITAHKKSTILIFDFKNEQKYHAIHYMFFHYVVFFMVFYKIVRHFA